ncbi:hypothetical protein [Leucobacter luti]|uniref:hypothetical protein n=1 Tax=Leucobacter luti TaxID=340320 RepID=UPI003D03AA6A
MSRSVEHELRTIRKMPYGTARIAAAEAISRRIEAEGPREHLAESLLDLVEAYTFADEGTKSFVVFARLLRLWDESPELFDTGDEHNLFWEFKWIAGDLPDFPQISRAQAEAFLADMERRFELAGHGLSSVRMSRFRWSWHSGLEDADEERLRWITGLRDEFEDCRACTIGQQVDFLTESGRHAEAVELGLTQSASCNLEPSRTNYAVALSALLVGQPELALTVHRRARAGDDGGPTDFSPARGQGFEMLARGGRLAEALRILRNDHVRLLTQSSTPLFRLRFLLGVLAGLSANLPSGDTEAAERETGLREPGWGTVSELRDWVLAEARDTAAALDARNGNARYESLIERALAAEPAAAPLPEPRAGAAEDRPAPARASDPGSGSGAVGREGEGGGFPGELPGSAEEAAAVSARLAEFAPDDLLARAEVEVRRPDFFAAGLLYEAAADGLRAGGWMARAGAARAEAAQCAATEEFEEGAHALFASAVQELRAGGADPDVLVAVIVAWAPIAARLDEAGELVAAAAAALEGHGECDEGDLDDKLAERRRAEFMKRRADLRDTLARSIASARPEQLPAGIDRAFAVAQATTAGEEYARLGRAGDAAHAFWLAGLLQRDAGNTEDAIWSFESAFEGFTIARLRSERAEAAGELIQLLRETGQEARAAEITAQLPG